MYTKVIKFVYKKPPPTANRSLNVVAKKHRKM